MYKIINKLGLGKNLRTLIIVLFLVLNPFFIGLISFGQHKVAEVKDPKVLGTKDANEIMLTLSKIMILPTDPPQIATVTDVEKLRDQKFFSEAKNGDKVVMFAISKKAILYRPSQKKIVEVSFYDPPNQVSSGLPEINSLENSIISPTPSIQNQ